LQATGPGCADTWEWQVGLAEGDDPLDDELHVIFLSEGCEVPRGAEWTFARIR
jgi:hypothetical protein